MRDVSSGGNESSTVNVVNPASEHPEGAKEINTDSPERIEANAEQLRHAHSNTVEGAGAIHINLGESQAAQSDTGAEAPTTSDIIEKAAAVNVVEIHLVELDHEDGAETPQTVARESVSEPAQVEQTKDRQYSPPNSAEVGEQSQENQSSADSRTPAITQISIPEIKEDVLERGRRRAVASASEHSDIPESHIQGMQGFAKKVDAKLADEADNDLDKRISGSNESIDILEKAISIEDIDEAVLDAAAAEIASDGQMNYDSTYDGGTLNTEVDINFGLNSQSTDRAVVSLVPGRVNAENIDSQPGSLLVEETERESDDDDDGIDIIVADSTIDEMELLAAHLAKNAGLEVVDVKDLSLEDTVNADSDSKVVETEFDALAEEKAAEARARKVVAAELKAAEEKHAKAKAAEAKAEQERAAQERAAQEKAAQEKAAQEKAAREKAAREKAAQEKAAQEKAAQEKAAQENKFDADALNEKTSDVPVEGVGLIPAVIQAGLEQSQFSTEQLVVSESDNFVDEEEDTQDISSMLVKSDKQGLEPDVDHLITVSEASSDRSRAVTRYESDVSLVPGTDADDEFLSNYDSLPPLGPSQPKGFVARSITRMLAIAKNILGLPRRWWRRSN